MRMLSAVRLGEDEIPDRLGISRTFETFFDAEAPVLFRRLCIITGNRSEAEELTQEAFVRLLERWERVSRMEDVSGYLYRVAFNLFRNHLRRARLALRETRTPAPEPDRFAAVEARQVVRQALARLTPRQRAALVLTDLMEYSSESAGKLLGVRPSTVRSLATQARAELRRTMGGTDE